MTTDSFEAKKINNSSSRNDWIGRRDLLLGGGSALVASALVGEAILNTQPSGGRRAADCFQSLPLSPA